MLRVALTGGIGTGKTHVLGRLAEAGVAVIDADRIVHGLMEPGGAVAAAVAARFGREMLDADGRVDRKRLGGLVFADAAARRDLEASSIRPCTRRSTAGSGTWSGRAGRLPLPTFRCCTKPDGRRSSIG